MNYFGDENNIISYLHMHCSKVEVLTDIDELATKTIELILNPQKWSLWIDTASKSDPPPDFYCPTEQIMMEVMRIDDHSFIGKKGGVINETNARESQIQKELRQLFPDTNHIIVNAITDLPGKEDHNYSRYLASIQLLCAHLLRFTLSFAS